VRAVAAAARGHHLHPGHTCDTAGRRLAATDIIMC